ncbi:hypothetical protein [Kaarinaea lacus]
MEIHGEDTYFLDRDLAYQTALAHNTFKMEDGRVLEQVCYYDGAPFEQAPKNLINVPAENFGDYFQIHFQRIPTRVEPTLSDFKGDPNTIHERLSVILNAVQNLCRKNYDKKDAA